MLALRQFDSTVSATDLGTGGRQHVVSTMLQFAAQPSSSLSAVIASFAHPVHVDVDSFLHPEDSDGIVESGSECREIDVAVGALEAPSGQGTAAESQPTEA